ncbi:DUF5671 domain-containing protein [Arthrobacter sp. PsM3]|uniref:DUF5671 domain-containing protein n=1 Tax=Arthrobacter sp. PsM3 TaxID=3030531 RepID=UPI00263BD916|nr:DUF5671 domain-containing protein [Arthrobacter sp. PsM3]MDN4646394.1 DUF5671 domain-containing protein [Arthrobacter sp. PsM3]
MSAASAAGSAQRTVRRLITYLLLFALVVIAAIGLSGLLERLLVAGTTLATGDIAGLARSLAFALIGGPLAAVLWWVVWRRLGDETERASVGWGLYMTGVYVLSLILATTNLLSTLTTLIGGRSLQWRPSLATGLVWAAVWVWHRWMWRHPRKRPLDLTDVPTVLGSYIGLVMGVSGAITALSILLDAALRGAMAAGMVGKSWWISALQSLVWAVGGGLVWWWHWKHDGGRLLRTDLASVVLMLVGVLGAGVLTLGGAGVTVFTLLRLAFDRTEPTEQLLEPLATAVAAAAVGSLVWAYHRALARGSSEGVRQGSRLITSGVALVAAASGVGVIVNAVLAMAATPFVGSGIRTLLLGGISSLLVGGPVWWVAWKPLRRTPAATPGAAGDSGRWQNARRVYLVVVFGLSAVVAVVTLLVIGYRVFEFFLGDLSGGSVVERIRAPLGLLVATGLVAGYHFAVWRDERAAGAAAGPARKRTIGHVVLVTGTDPAPLHRVIEDVTGAGVTVWRRADVGALPVPVAVPGTGTVPGAGAGADAGQLAGRLAAELEGVTGARVLVTVSPDGRIDVIPLLG